MLLKYVYVSFIGLLVALFVGVGIAAFYPGPTPPQSNDIPVIAPGVNPSTASESAKIAENEQIRKDRQAWDQYQDLNKAHSKYVAIIALVSAIIILALSFALPGTLLLIADGLLLGALLTLIYSIISSFSTDDFKFIFVLVTIGLLIAISLGYIKFIRGKVIH